MLICVCLCVYRCVCENVCVCVNERERETKGDSSKVAMGFGRQVMELSINRLKNLEALYWWENTDKSKVSRKGQYQ